MSSESPTNKSKAMPMLYHRLYCSSSPIVQTLIELGIKDDKVTVKTITSDEQKEESFLKLNASGQIPVYVDESGNAIAESISIMLRILDDFDTEDKLLPASGHRRYVTIEAMSLAATSLVPTLAIVDSGSEDAKKEARKLAETKLTVAVEAMLKRFDGPYILGDTMSAADFFLTYSLLGMKYIKEGEPCMMTDAIKIYLDTMEKLPSTREVFELDNMEKKAAATTEEKETTEEAAAATEEKETTEEAVADEDTKMEEVEKPAAVEEEEGKETKPAAAVEEEEDKETKPAVAVEEEATDIKSMEVEADKNPAEEVKVSKKGEEAGSKPLEESTPADEAAAATTA